MGGAIEVGTICVKTTGREAGQRAVVVKRIDKNFVLIDSVEGSRVRKRRCNVAHLVPIGRKK